MYIGYVVGRPSSGVPTALRLIVHHPLPFVADRFAGLSTDGSIVMADKNKPELHSYTYSAGKYSQLCRKSLPRGMKYDCFKATSNSEIILQQDEDTDTVHYSKDLDERQILQRRGELCDCWDDGHVIYGRLASGNTAGWVVDIYNQQPVMTLKPPHGCTWDRGLSVCSLGHIYGVVVSGSQSLTTFSRQGRDQSNTIALSFIFHTA